LDQLLARFPDNGYSRESQEAGLQFISTLFTKFDDTNPFTIEVFNFVYSRASFQERFKSIASSYQRLSLPGVLLELIDTFPPLGDLI